MVSREDIMKQVKSDLKGSYSTEDFLMHASSAVDTIDAVLNEMFESIRNWYQIYLPELPDSEDRKVYLEVVEKYIKEQPATEKLLSERAARLLPKRESMGSKIPQEDLYVLQEYAKKLRGMYEAREDLGNYVEKTVEKIAPNLAYIVGNMLATKLIVSAKGVKKLARLPASSIQVMGAEKALFMHLIKHTKPPKHGIIFLHPSMRGIKKGDRGKVARLISAKISIAAKADAYTHNFIAPKLKEELDRKVGEIIKKSGFATKEDMEMEQREKDEKFRQRLAEGKGKWDAHSDNYRGDKRGSGGYGGERRERPSGFSRERREEGGPRFERRERSGGSSFGAGRERSERSGYGGERRESSPRFESRGRSGGGSFGGERRERPSGYSSERREEGGRSGYSGERTSGYSSERREEGGRSGYGGERREGSPRFESRGRSGGSSFGRGRERSERSSYGGERKASSPRFEGRGRSEHSNYGGDRKGGDRKEGGPRFSRDNEEKGGRQAGGRSEGGMFERRERKEVGRSERSSREERGERGVGRGGKFRKKRGGF